jgi:hypothetical protein
MMCGRLPYLTRLCVAAIAVATIISAPTGAVSAPASAEVTVDVVGTTLRVRLPDGSVREGAALVGAALIVAVDSQTLKVRIAAVERDARDPQGEVLLYDFRVIAANGSEEPLCQPDPDGRRLGLPLAGQSDAAGFLSPSAGNAFELVCTSAPQGKCARLGYAPWREAPDGRSMRDWFNACVRMMRGDYCGDGRPYTRNGTLIDIYDRIGVQRSDNDPSLSFEAVWEPQGAVCVARTRIPEIITIDALAEACPRLAKHLGPAACTDNVPGGLISNRSR